MDSATSMTAAPTSSGRGLLLLGIGVAVGGVAAYAVQFALGQLMLPWYMPAAAVLGLVLVFLAFCRRRTRGRGLALAAVVLLAGLEAALFLGMRLPAYTGPVAVGQRFPAFTTRRADGRTFRERDLGGSSHDVLVFFRGRW